MSVPDSLFTSLEPRRSRTVWLVGGAVLLAAAGVLVGMWLYPSFSATVTPIGQIAKVQTAECFAPAPAELQPCQGDAPGQPRAVAGYRLWAVHFRPVAASPARAEETIQKALVIDDHGEKHLVAMSWTFQHGDTLRGRALVFSVPEGRRPLRIQFGEAPPLRLPTP